jgi:asparagine synthase (glutamine-hydrolysing)
MTHVGIFAASPPVNFGEVTSQARGARALTLSAEKTDGYVVRRVSNGIWNRGLQATSDRFSVFIDGELRHRARLWKSLGRGLAKECPGTDQELLLALLTTHPLSHIASRAEGSFFIAAIDRQAQAILFANDRFGLRPHYYCSKGTTLVLAPSIKACLTGGRASARLDVQSLAEFFSFQCVMEERTLLADISVFPAGSAAVFDLRTGTFSVTAYHSWAELISDGFGGTFEAAVEEATFLFRQACAEASRSGLRLGVYLSGGLDSRSILAAVPAGRTIDTFSFGPPDSPDLVYAARCASAMGTSHHEFVMTDGAWISDIAVEHTELAECGHSLVHAHNFWRAWDAGACIDVNLHGHFGDLLFGGSYVYHGTTDGLLPSLLGVFLSKWGYGNGSIESALAALCPKRPHLAEAIRTSFAASLASFEGLPPTVAHDLFALQFHGRKQIQYYMVHNTPYFESRTPYLDLDLLRCVLNLPASFRANRRLQIAALEKMRPRLTRIPWAGTDLPVINSGWPKVRSRAERFVNTLAQSMIGRRLLPPRAPLFNDCYPQWFGRDLREWVCDSVNSAENNGRQFLAHAFACGGVDGREMKVDGGRYSAARIGAMLSLHLFLGSLDRAHG